MPNFQIRRPDALTLFIAAAALFGAALVLFRQSLYGVSVSADSGHYIAMARNALAGHGFMSFDGRYPPEWPPLASALYAVFSFGAFDPMAVAGPLNAAMFTLTVFTVGMWLRRRAESPFAVAWACLGLVFGLAAIRMFDWIWSEPSFILATTLALYWADRHLEDGERASLAWAVAFSAAACLSKYVGAALVVAVAGMILLRRGVSWRERLLSAAAYSAISLLPICAWMARNWLNTGLLTGGRPVVETAREHVAPMLAEVARWWLPHVPIPVAEGGALAVTALALSVAAVLALHAAFRWLRADGRATAPLLAAFAAAYAALTLWGLRTGAVNIDRYAAPMFVPLLLSAALALDRALSWARGVRWRGGRIPSFALMAILAAWTAFGGYVAISDARARATEHGEGRVDGGFYASETIQRLRGLRGETAIGVGYSNQPLQAYLASDGRGIYPNPPYHWSEMAAALEARHGAADDTIIAWFHDGISKRYGVSAFLYSPGFERLGSFPDGDVFRLKRGRPPADPRAGTQILDSHYDVYLNGGYLAWVRQPCADGDAGGFVELWAAPANPDDPRADVNEYGIVSMNFDFWRFGAKIGDLCAVRRPLPDYPLRRIGTGQNVPGDKWLYREAIPLPVSDEARAYYIRKYEALSAGGEPLARGEWDVYLDDGGDLVYLKQPCAADDTRGSFLLSVFPVDLNDIPQDRRAARHEGHNFAFKDHGVRFGDRCMIRRSLPNYAIESVNVGRWVDGESGGWPATRVPMPMSDAALAYYEKQYETISSGGEPLARAEYDVYLDGGELVYLKRPCAESDTRGRFLLSVFPADLDDVSQKWRELGHESLNFGFGQYGVRFGDRCMIRIPLPDYAIEAVDVGRWVPGETAAWEKTRVRLPLGDSARAYYRSEYETVSAGEPLFAGEYGVYLDGGDLVYLKRPCAEGDTRGRFLLSVFPQNVADLPEDWRGLGYESLNFEFAQYGVRFDGRCMARRPLPDYAIAGVETGRWIPGEREVWRASFAVSE